MALLNYNNQPDHPGIYVIFNKAKWRLYIGQASCFKNRWHDHLKSLHSNRHSNRFLQADWSKSGEEAFEFHVLEVMPNSTKEERNLQEEYWINIHWDKQERCYNFKKKTEANERSCYSLTPKETAARISATNKKRWEDPNYREKRLLALRSPEFKEKQRAIRLKQIAENGGKDLLTVSVINAWKDPEKRKIMTEKARANAVAYYSTAEFKQKQESNQEKQRLVSLERKRQHLETVQVNKDIRGQERLAKRIIKKQETEIRQKQLALEKQNGRRLKQAERDELFVQWWKDPEKRAKRIEEIRKAQLGKKLSSEIKQKISQSHKSLNRHPENKTLWKAVVGTNVLTGERVCFESIAHAQRQLGIKNGICRAIKGERKSAGGYTWAYSL